MIQYGAEAMAVTGRFILWFMLFPLFIVQGQRKFHERVATSFIFMVAASTIVILLLSALRIYDPFAFWGLLITVATISVARQRRGKEHAGRVWMRRLDWVEERHGEWLKLIALLIRDSLKRLGGIIVAAVRNPHFLTWVVGLGAFGWSAWLRYFPYLEKAYLGAAQGYQHLTWTKYLERAQLFQDGLYPFGYHAVMGAVGSLTFLDRFLLFRFAGPIAGVLLVLSVAFSASHLRLVPAAVAVAMALFGLAPGSPFPADAFFQSQPLPEEFAALFVLPTIVLAWRFLREGDQWTGAASLASLFMAVVAGPYTLPYFGGLFVVGSLAALTARAVSPGRLLRSWTAGVGAVTLGLLPLAIGYAVGKRPHSDFTWGFVTQLTDTMINQRNALVSNRFVQYGIVLGLTLLIWGVARLRRDPEHTPFYCSVGLLLLCLVTQVSRIAQIPAMLTPFHARLIFGLLLALGTGMLLDALLRMIRVQFHSLIACFLVAAQVTWWWPVPNRSAQLEYEDAVKAFIAISKSYPRYSWTLIGPTEQYSQVLNVGWHEELGQFLRKVDVEKVQQGDFQLYIPTPDVFLYVEKIPFYSTEPINPDIHAPVNFEGLEDSNILYARYHDGGPQRRLMEQRLWGIVEAYAANHPGEVTIFFESKELRVYRIHHDPKKINR